MKLIRTNISDGITTVHTHEITAFEIREKNGKKRYWYADKFGEMGYPEALVTAYEVNGEDHYLTVNWDNMN